MATKAPLNRPTAILTRTFWTRLDNYEPIGREHYKGRISTWTTPQGNGEYQYVIEPGNPFYAMCGDGPNPNFILDDGMELITCYVSGWQPSTGQVFIQPFPVNPDGNTRPDGRVIDYSTWSLGPRTTYHLKLHE